MYFSICEGKKFESIKKTQGVFDITCNGEIIAQNINKKECCIGKIISIYVSKTLCVIINEMNLRGYYQFIVAKKGLDFQGPDGKSSQVYERGITLPKNPKNTMKLLQFIDDNHFVITGSDNCEHIVQMDSNGITQCKTIEKE